MSSEDNYSKVVSLMEDISKQILDKIRQTYKADKNLVENLTQIMTDSIDNIKTSIISVLDLTPRNPNQFQFEQFDDTNEIPEYDFVNLENTNEKEPQLYDKIKHKHNRVPNIPIDTMPMRQSLIPNFKNGNFDKIDQKIFLNKVSTKIIADEKEKAASCPTDRNHLISKAFLTKKQVKDKLKELKDSKVIDNDWTNKNFQNTEVNIDNIDKEPSMCEYKGFTADYNPGKTQVDIPQFEDKELEKELYELDEIMELCSIQYREYQSEFDLSKYNQLKHNELELIFTDMDKETEDQCYEVVRNNLSICKDGKQFCKEVVRHMTEMHSKQWYVVLGLHTPTYAFFTFGKIIKFKVKEDLSVTMYRFDQLLI